MSKIKLFTFIAILLTGFTGCRKFENFNTLLEVVVPNDCEECTLYMEYALRPFGQSAENVSPPVGVATIKISDGKKVEVEIDWEALHELDGAIEPYRGRVEFFLDDETISNGPSGIPSGYAQPTAKDWTTGEVKVRPGRGYRWDAEAGTFEKTGEKTDRKDDGGSGSGGGGSACYHGTFSRDNGSSKDDTWTLRSNGTGSAFFADLNGYCEGANFKFDYTLSGDQLSISYTSAKVCGEPQPLPDDESITFSCDNSGIYVGSDFYAR